MEIMIAAIAGLLLNGIAWIAKKNNWTIKTDTVVLLAAVVIGVCYATFQVAIPPAAQEQVVDFVSKAMATSWIIWQFFVKRFVTKEIPPSL